MKKTKINPFGKGISSLFIAIFLLANMNINAQTDISDNDQNKQISKYSITASGGATLMWGDLAQEYDNPLGKYFTNQQGWAGGLMLSRKLGNSFSINLQYIGGYFQGHKDTWSNGNTANAGFYSKFHNANLNLELDILNLLNNKETRMIAPYIKAGFGYGITDSKRTIYSTGEEVASYKTSFTEIPWGWGLRFDLSRKWSIRFEHTFHMAMNDLADGYDSEWSDVNDIYSYTSLGATYRFPSKVRKPKMPKEEEIEPIEEIALVEDIKPIFNLNIATSIPSTMHPYDSSDVVIRINKGDIKGSAKLQQTLPKGFSAIKKENSGAEFKFTNQILSYEWTELPDDKSVEISYILVTNNAEIKENNISGIMFYDQNDSSQIRQFNKRILIKPTPVEAIIAVVDPVEEIIPIEKPKEVITTPPADKPLGKLVYKVQVYAVYGGTTSKGLLQKRLKLKHKVEQDYQGKYSKYTSGEFATYAEAAAYKSELRNSTVPGAFVVGYYDEKRTNNIQDAIAIEKGAEPLASPISAKGKIYRIQIMASAKDLTISEVQNITGTTLSFVKVKHNGLYKYEVGNYKSYSEVKKAIQDVRDQVSDAFIVTYVDGIR